MNQKIRIILITGFLGAGKTSFLNHLLSENNHRTIKIIENEIGEVNIDGKLLKGQVQGNLIEVSDGCICCSVASKLIEAMEELLRESDSIEYLIIEATGVADPIAIVAPIKSDSFLMQNYEISGVVCLADAVLMPVQINEYPEIGKQLSVADFIFINKADLIIEQEKQSLENLVRQYNPLAAIEFTSYGKTNTQKILEFRMSDGEHTKNQIRRISNIQANKHSKIEVSFIELQGYFETNRFEFWFEYFLSLNKNSIIRIKAILHFEDSTQPFVLQSVGSAYTLESIGYMHDITPGHNQFVLIGKNIKRESILESLNYLLEGDLNVNTL